MFFGRNAKSTRFKVPFVKRGVKQCFSASLHATIITRFYVHEVSFYGKFNFSATSRTNRPFQRFAVASPMLHTIAAPYSVWLRFQYTRSISSMRWRPCFITSVSEIAARTASYRRCSLSVSRSTTARSTGLPPPLWPPDAP